MVEIIRATVEGDEDPLHFLLLGWLALPSSLVPATLLHALRAFPASRARGFGALLDRPPIPLMTEGVQFRSALHISLSPSSRLTAPFNAESRWRGTTVIIFLWPPKSNRTLPERLGGLAIAASPITALEFFIPFGDEFHMGKTVTGRTV